MGLIGGYEVVGELARGAMGVVYRGRDPRDGSFVAIKVLAAARGALADEVRRARFRREADALQRLRHPGVVALRGVGEEQGVPYLVLDLVEGGSLADRLARGGPLAPRDAAAMVAAVARALEAAHALGIVHRDLKPANVLVDARGSPRLTDFGLVLDLDQDVTRLSKTGQLLGTPGYWAPEQASGERARMGPHTDVYGLGALLYAALTGEPPCGGNTLIEAIVAARDRVPDPPSARRRDVDSALDAIALRCLEKDPVDRFPDAASVARALDEVAHPPALGRARRPRRRRWSQPALAALIGAALLVVGAAVGVIVGRRGDGSASTTSTEAVPPAVDVKARVNDLVARGRERLDADDPTVAIALFTEAIVLAPDTASALAWRAVARLRTRGGATQDVDGAVADARRAVDLAPDTAEAHLALGSVYGVRSDFEACRRELDRALELDPEHVESRVYRASLRLSHLDDAKGAEEDFTEVVRRDPENSEAFLNRGAARLLLQDYAGAIDDLTETLRLKPGQWSAHINRGQMREVRGDLDGATDDFAAYVALRPDDPAMRKRLIDMLLARALRRIDAGNPKAAADDLAACLDAGGDPIAVKKLRGVARAMQDDFEGAKADFEDVVRALPRDVTGLSNLGRFRSMRGDDEGALQVWAIALEVDPEALGVRLQRGDVLRRQGDLAAAAADYAVVLRKMPTLDRAAELREFIAKQGR